MPHRLIIASAVIALGLALVIDRGGAQDGGASRADRRASIRLSAKERAHLRRGMRAFLERVEGIVAGLAENDMALVAKNAKRAGMAMVSEASISMAGKLPAEFVLLSIDTHQKFDALSLAAAESGSKTGATKLLRGILANCTGCHATYRVVPE